MKKLIKKEKKRIKKDEKTYQEGEKTYQEGGKNVSRRRKKMFDVQSFFSPKSINNDNHVILEIMRPCQKPVNLKSRRNLVNLKTIISIFAVFLDL